MRPHFGAKILLSVDILLHSLIFTKFTEYQQFFWFLVMASTNPEAEEVSRVNKLLQIEDLAWSRQLEKAESV